MATSAQSDSDISPPIGINTSRPRFLDYNECLVYLETKYPFADTDGVIHIARVLRTPISDDRVWYEIQLVTDQDGDRITSLESMTVPGDRIVSDRSFRDIEPRQFYNFSTMVSYTNQTDIQYPLQAISFVIKDNVDRPLEITSRSGLGSGIYGLYVRNESDIPNLRTDPSQVVNKIDCPNAYPIQDKEHGDSITVASLHTNRYLDRIIQALRFNGPHENLNIDNALELIRMNSITNLVTLWNIVFYRTQDILTQDWLEQTLADYVVRYLQDDSLQDTINGNSIQELPINDIMTGMGYEGLIADDSYNNGWNRGCVSYNYSQATILQGSIARYLKAIPIY